MDQKRELLLFDALKRRRNWFTHPTDIMEKFAILFKITETVQFSCFIIWTVPVSKGKEKKYFTNFTSKRFKKKWKCVA